MYEYNDLPPRSIRLLTILPGQHQDPLIARLTVAQLDEEPSYEAFSYLWGPPSFTASLYLAGENTLSSLSPEEKLQTCDATWITESLAEGLRQYRYVADERAVWVDQICINQKDLEERAAQVELMGDIYERAAKVLLWLGPDADNDAPVANTFMEVLAHARGKMKGEQLKAWVLTHDETTTFGEHPLHSVVQMPNQDAPEWAALKRLIELPYWGRAWILQEVLLATEKCAMWGCTPINTDALSEAIVWMLHSEGPNAIEGSPKKFQYLVFHCLTGQSGRNVDSLAQGLVYMQERQATDPRDKVYSLLGILRNRDPVLPRIRVDYSKSVLEVYVDAVIASIHENGDLDALARIHLTEEAVASSEGDRWPTWVPDLESRPGPVPLVDYLKFASACGPIENADRSTDAAASNANPLAKVKIMKEGPTKENHHTLTLEGITVAKVSTTSTFRASAEDNMGFYRYASEAWKIASDTLSPGDFVDVIICGTGSYWETTGDHTEMNQSGAPGFSSGYYYYDVDIARKRFIRLQKMRANTFIMFAYMFAESLDGLRQRIVTSEDSFNVVEEIKLVDGLVSWLYDFRYQLENNEMLYWVPVFVDPDEELRYMEAYKVASAETRRSRALESFRQEEPERHDRIKGELESKLRPYYASDNELHNAVSMLLLVLYEGQDIDSALLQQLVSRYTRLALCRRFFKTSDGKFGLGPNCMRAGDVIAILAGGKTPFVLRPVGDKYVFIGDCYVKQFMKGGALEAKESAPLETFTLLGTEQPPYTGS